MRTPLIPNNLNDLFLDALPDFRKRIERLCDLEIPISNKELDTIPLVLETLVKARKILNRKP
jgi:hypothetical protein